MTQKRRRKADIRVEGSLAYIPLTKGLEAVIDVADLPLVSGRVWHATKAGLTFYACSNKRLAECADGKRGGKWIMHCVIHPVPLGFEVDHWDRDGLNNRRYNLRTATREQNAFNTGVRSHNRTGLKGVSHDPRRNRYYAKIDLGGRRQKYLGSFSTAEDAYSAYLAEAAKVHGEFNALT